mgnify:CR=1 FL=1
MSNTWPELVRTIWPKATDDQVELLLWETTCYPMGSAEQVEQQLRDIYTKSNGDVALALEITYKEISEQMAKNATWEALSDEIGRAHV